MDSPAQVADTGKSYSNMTKHLTFRVGLDRVAVVDVIIYSGRVTVMCSLFPLGGDHSGVQCSVK